MLSANWQAVILDLILLLDFFAIALWFSDGMDKPIFRWMAVAFAVIGASYIILTIGDLLIALNYTREEIWLLDRAWRALSWRYGAATGFSIFAGVLRFGRFNGDG